MLRRLIALAILIFTGYIAMRAHQGDFGMLSPVALICAIIIAIIAFAGIFSNLPFVRRYPDDGFGMSKPVGLGIGYIGIFLFAVIPLLIAARGVYTGVLSALGSGPDVSFAVSPMQFLGILLFWLAVGLGIFWLLIKVRRANADQANKDNES